MTESAAIDKRSGAGALSQLARLLGLSGERFSLLSPLIAVVLGLLIFLPLARIVYTTMSAQGLSVWQQVLASDLSRNLFWEPLINSVAIGALVSAGCVLIGGLLAYVVVLTDTPGRALLGVLASIPFVLPSFALALSWEVIFRNELIGGHVGLLRQLGVPVADWLAWGFVPTAATLIAHYYSLAFMLIAAALSSVNADLIDAAEMTGAGRWRILSNITLPVVFPSILAAALLAFAEGVSNFAVPALLGLPVRFHTLSTRLYGMMHTGQIERGYVLTILLIAVASLLLWAGNRAAASRRSYVTITGKGGRYKRFTLGSWRWGVFTAGFSVCLVTTVIPFLALLVSSLGEQTGSWSAGFTLHYWIGASHPNFAQGHEGVLRNGPFLSAAATTVLLGGSVALVGTAFGLIIGYVLARSRPTPLSALISQLSYLPILIPGIALGAAYIAQFGQPLGPIPALYGSFALLVIAGVAATLPFSAQSGRAAVGQVSNELEEAARLTKARLPRRLLEIFLPLTARGLIAGAVLVFVKMVRDLSLVVLLVTPTTSLLSVLAFRYASEGFPQLAHAVTVVIATISVAATLLARWLQGATQPWIEHS